MSGQLEHIRTFLAVAARGGFSNAARDLGLSPTIVTRHIAELEADLGVQLFTRTTRRVDLTDAGRSYQDKVAEVVRALDDANENVRARQVGLTGPLRVSAPMSFGTRFLPDIIAQFRILHPGVHLQLDLTDRFVDIASESFDLALRISEPPQDQMTLWKKICAIERIIVASPRYLSVRGVPERPESLRQHDCLFYGHGPRAPVWDFRKSGKDTRVRISPCFSSNSGDLLGQLAERGEGIAVLPRFIVRQAVESGALVQVLADWMPPDIWLAAATAPFETLPAKVETFAAFVEAQMIKVSKE